MRAREAARRRVACATLARAAARRARAEPKNPALPSYSAPNRHGASPALRATARNGSARSHSCLARCRQLCVLRRMLARNQWKLAEPTHGAPRPGSSAPATPATTPGGYHSESPRRFVETPAPLTHSTRGYCAMAPARVKHIDGTTAHGRGFCDAVGSHDGGEVRAQGASRRRTRVPLSEARAGHLAVVVLEARGRTRARSPTPADIASQLPAAPRASTRPASRGPPTARPSMRRARFAQIAAPAPSQPLTHP
jgi:hypothetical protein